MHIFPKRKQVMMVRACLSGTVRPGFSDLSLTPDDRPTRPTYRQCQLIQLASASHRKWDCICLTEKSVSS